MNHDSIELTQEFKAIIVEAEEAIREELRKEGLPTEPAFMGWCHAYWRIKRRVLKDNYGIDWHSPAMMNPGVLFD
jgi:hypothetical protein